MRRSVAGLAWLLVGCSDGGLHSRLASSPEDTGEPASAEDWSPASPDGAPMFEGWGDPLPDPPDPADPLFADGVITPLTLELPDASRHALSADPRTDVQATLRCGDRTWVVGVHLKGSFSFRDLSGKPSWKIDVGQYVPGQRFYGLRRITLNNMIQDRSMIREHEAYRAYAQLGVPAPRHGYATLSVDGVDYGLYGLLETLDGTWAERVFPGDSEGPIYEGGYGVDLSPGKATSFDMQRQGDLVEPFSDLAELIDAIEDTPDEDTLDLLEERFDAQAVLRSWAEDLVAGHDDGYVRRANNFLLYHALREDRWWFVPWGQDQTFRGNGRLHANYSGRLAKKCLKAPRCLARLDEAVEYVTELWEARGLADHAEATGAAIDETCEEDPRKELACGYDSVVDVIRERPEEVRAELAAPEE